VLGDLAVFDAEPVGLGHREGLVRGREDGVHRAVVGVDGPGGDVAPVHRRVDRDQGAVGDGVVDVVVQAGERGAQPQRGGVDAGRARNPRRWWLGRVLAVDGARVVQGVEVGPVPVGHGVNGAHRYRDRVGRHGRGGGGHGDSNQLQLDCI
jgi:hypothetical protein